MRKWLVRLLMWLLRLPRSHQAWQPKPRHDVVRYPTQPSYPPKTHGKTGVSASRRAAKKRRNRRRNRQRMNHA